MGTFRIGKMHYYEIFLCVHGYVFNLQNLSSKSAFGNYFGNYFQGVLWENASVYPSGYVG